jgi:hypothetical protein
MDFSPFIIVPVVFRTLLLQRPHTFRSSGRGKSCNLSLGAAGFLQCRLSHLGGEEKLQAHLQDLVLELFDLVDMSVLVFKNLLKNFTGGKIFDLASEDNGVIV